MKKIKCEKCGLYYKDRGEDDFLKGSGYVRTLCWNCGFLWSLVGIYIKGITDYALTKNREITISIDSIKIRRLPSNKH